MLELLLLLFVLCVVAVADIPAGVQYSNFFFIYVCKKQPLQLPQHHGQKAALPNGWVAGSKELFQKWDAEFANSLESAAGCAASAVCPVHPLMHPLPTVCCMLARCALR